MHPSVQVVRGSTNIDLSRAEDEQTADRSNAPIAAGTDVEVRMKKNRQIVGVNMSISYIC